MIDHVSKDLARDLCAFIEASPSPWHAVAEAQRRLEAAGFSALDEADPWPLAPGARRYVIRGGTSLAAFVIGETPPAKAGFTLIGSHTDSPNLRLKTRAAYAESGYAQLGVEVYGGVLLHTWLDRDLGLSGRVVVADEGAPEGVRVELVRVDEPVCRVPSLAIHLNRDVNDKGLQLNKQTQLAPLFGQSAREEDAREQLRALLQGALGARSGTILGHDLCLHVLEAPRLGGAREEFIFAPRLDNLASVHASVTALVRAAGQAVEETRLIALFDHEEIGSQSMRGAAGSFLKDTLTRLVEAHPDGHGSALQRALARSFCISADMAHAVHPNYTDRHEPRHLPHLGHGPVIKSNTNQRYASDGETTARFRALCRKAEVPFQEFVNRTDLACGSTIGPITAAELGVRAVDIGNPMLSMHSSREMAGTADVPLMARALTGFFGVWG